MAWIDDRAWVHPKIVPLSDKAFRVWVSGISYSTGMGVSGVLAPAHQRLVGASSKVKRELVDAGLWDPQKDGSIIIHDWEQHNGKRDARRAADRERKRVANRADIPQEPPQEVPQEPPQDRSALTGDRVTGDVEPNGSTRPRNEIWDALVEVFGEPSTDTARSLRGKVCASLTRAGATHDELIARAKSWPRYFESATLTETALEKHWDALGRPPLRAAR